MFRGGHGKIHHRLPLVCRVIPTIHRRPRPWLLRRRRSTRRSIWRYRRTWVLQRNLLSRGSTIGPRRQATMVSNRYIPHWRREVWLRTRPRMRTNSIGAASSSVVCSTRGGKRTPGLPRRPPGWRLLLWLSRHGRILSRM